MKKISEFMTGVVNRKGIGREAEAALVCFLAERWGGSRFVPLSFSRGVLKLSVASSSAAQALQMEEEKLIDYLNEKLGKIKIKSIRIVLAR